MTTRTLGRLWTRYLEIKQRLENVSPSTPEEERQELEREARNLRDRLLVNYSPLVKYIAGLMGARMTGPVDQEDFISWGILGLLDAIETYDPNRGAKFESYATSKVKWSILDALRKQDWVPQRVRARSHEVEEVRTRLTQELRRPPTEKEVAHELGVGLDKHRAFLEQFTRASVRSLEAQAESEAGPMGEFGEIVADRTVVDPQSRVEQTEVRSRLVGAIRALEEQERVVATFYFYEGLTLKEIGKALGLTEGRISQILRRAVDKLRDLLSDSPVFSTRA